MTRIGDWRLFVFCGSVIFLSATSITLMTPFYSKEAESREVGVQYHGFVLGTYQLVMVTLSPVFGKLVGRLGPVKIFRTCSVIFTVGCFLFGLLEIFSDRTLFLYMSFIFRMVQAIGCCGIFASTFVLISFQSPEFPATAFAGLQTFIAAGIALGPTFGGAFYDVGGFFLPFTVLGLLLVLFRFLSTSILESNTLNPGQNEQKLPGIRSLLKIPSILLSFIAMICTAMTIGFICTTLEPHLRQFSLSSTSVGLIQAVNGMSSALTSPLWGYICDKMKFPLRVSVCGNACIFFAFLLIGPTSLLPVPTLLWLTILGLFIQGLGVGASFTSAFSVALRDSSKHGFSNDMPTYAIVATLWQSTLCLGIWLGTGFSGVLIEWTGFRESSSLFLITSLIMIFFVGAWLYFGNPQVSRHDYLLFCMDEEKFQFLKNSQNIFYGSSVANLNDDFIYNSLAADTRSLSL